MTQRSIQAGSTPTVIINAGMSVQVRGVEGSQVSAETTKFWGLKVEHKNDEIRIDIGGSGKVFVPISSNLTVHTGIGADIQGVHGGVLAYTGTSLTVRGARMLVNASTGRNMDIEADSIQAKNLKLSAGGDLRIYIRDLTSALFKINDIGGYWEARIGSGEFIIKLNAGGDVILVTDQKVEAMPPDYVLGKIEQPSGSV